MPHFFKKYLSVGLLCSFFLFGCASQAPDISFKTQDFSYDFEWNDQLETSYARQDSYDELTYGGPFYFGNFEGLDPFTQTYSQARAQKVRSMVSVMDATIDELVLLEDELKNMRNIFDWYAFGIMSIDPDIKETMLLFVDNVTGPAIQNNLKLSYLKTLRDTLPSEPDNAEWGLMQYQKYAGLTDTYHSYTQEIQNHYTNFLFLSQLIAQDENSAYRTHNADLDWALNPVSDRLSQILTNINYNIASLSYEEQLLFTTDYYFADKMVAFLDEQFEQLTTQLEAYDGSKELVDEYVIAFIVGNLEDVEELKLHLQMKMEAVAENELLPLELFATKQEIALIHTAHAFNPLDIFDNALNSAVSYASNNSIIQKGVKTFQRVTKPAEDMLKAGVDMTWSGIKAVGKEAYAATKDVGQMVGVGLDSANAAVKSVVDISQEVYYSQNLSWRDTFIHSLQHIDRNIEEVQQNYLLAKSGGSIFDEAEAVLNDTEEMAEFVIDQAAQSTGSQGMISTGIGMTAKMAVGFFTGFAKDTYAVLNPNKDEAETAMAMGGLALAATGGSQSVGKASQVARQAGKGTKVAYQEGLKKVLEVNPQKIKNALQTMKQKAKEVATHPGEYMEMAVNNTLIDLRSGYKATRNNLKKNVSKSFTDFFEEFPNTANGVMDSMKSVMGYASDSGTMRDNFFNMSTKLFDSFAGGYVDNEIKNMIGSFVGNVTLAKANNPGLNAEELGMLDMIADDIIIETKKEMPYLKYAETPKEPAPKKQTEEEILSEIDQGVDDISNMMSEMFGDDWENVQNERKEKELAEARQREKEARERQIQADMARIQAERARAQQAQQAQPIVSPDRDTRHDWLDTETMLPKANVEQFRNQQQTTTTPSSSVPTPAPTVTTSPPSNDDVYNETMDALADELDGFSHGGGDNFDFLGEIPDEDDTSGEEYFDEVLEEAPAPQGGENNFFHGIDMSQEMSTGSGN